MTFVPTRLSFNAAFLREIKEDDHRLRELFHETEQLFTSPRVDTRKLVTRRLWQLRDQLAMHFALENAFGYLAHVVEHAPRLCERAQRMVAEHDDLFLQLCDIIELSEEVSYHEIGARRGSDVARAFFEFQRQFCAHERHENELLFDAFDDDLGDGD